MIPALFTTTSMRPKRSRVASIKRSTSSRFPASAGTASAGAPRASSSFTAASRRAASRPETTTEAPSSASDRAMARPMPRPPPVTIATFPARALASVRSRGPARRPPRRALSSDAGSSTAWPRAPSSVRLSSPVSTRPGPTSRNPVAPSRARRSTQSVQRTGLATCWTRNGFTSSAVRVTPPSTLRTTGMRGSLTATRSSSAARRSAAGFMSAQWKGALTGSSTLFRPPRAAAASTARSTAARCPAMTIWPGRVDVGHPHHLALRRLRADLLDGGQLHAQSAAIAPVPTGTASCMNSPRRRTRRTASAKRERARDHERRVLAQAVAGGEGRA